MILPKIFFAGVKVCIVSLFFIYLFFLREKENEKKEKEKKGKETEDLHFSLKIYWVYENSSFFFPPIKELIPWSQQGYGCEAILSKP